MRGRDWRFVRPVAPFEMMKDNECKHIVQLFALSDNA